MLPKTWEAGPRRHSGKDERGGKWRGRCGLDLGHKDAVDLRCDFGLLQVVKALHFLQKELRIIHRGMDKQMHKGGEEVEWV